MLTEMGPVCGKCFKYCCKPIDSLPAAGRLGAEPDGEEEPRSAASGEADAKMADVSTPSDPAPAVAGQPASDVVAGKPASASGATSDGGMVVDQSTPEEKTPFVVDAEGNPSVAGKPASPVAALSSGAAATSEAGVGGKPSSHA